MTELDCYQLAEVRQSAQPPIAILAEVHDELVQTQGEEIDFGYGRLFEREHASIPRIHWVLVGGSMGPSENVDNVDGSLATRVCRYAVSIWHRDNETVLTTHDNLLRALRVTCHGPNVAYGDFEIETENPDLADWMLGGALLTCVISIKLDVKRNPALAKTLARIQSQTHTVSLNGEEVC